MKLFTPVKIGPLTLKNRLVMPAVHHCYTPDGLVNDRLTAYYETRARGGVAMITVGGCTIDRLGAGPSMIGLHDDRFIGGLSKLVEAINRHDTAAAAQLYQAGRYSHSIFSGEQPAAPSPLPSRLTRETPRKMTLTDIEDTLANFAAAALRAKAAGFQAVEVIASAGYLICQFLSPLTNQRSDQYGGSWENRSRFGVEVIRRVRSALGPDFPLIVRLSGHDFMAGGNGNKEAACFAALLEQEGVDCFNVTGGWHESRVPQITADLPRGAFAYLARGIKEAVKVPVIASNRINDPQVAEVILAHNLADLVNMGRPLIADPDLPNKAKSGDFGAIRHCIACNQGCLDMVFTMQDVYCTVNPVAGRELSSDVASANQKKNVLVVGGGPGGMEAAVNLAGRGHKVTLWEKGAALGGNLRYAAMPPGKTEFKSQLRYYEQQLPRQGVEVYLNREANAAEIIAFGADEVVLASGAKAAKAPFPISADAPPIVSAGAVLDGSALPGENVVVIGGGSVGCETALAVAEMGTISADVLKFLFENDAENLERLKELLCRGSRNVSLVEMEDGIGRDFGISTRWVVLKSIRRAGIKVLDGHRVCEISVDGVVVEKEGSRFTLPADTVVMAIGAVPNNDLATQLDGQVKGLHLIGDAVKPRKLTEAIREGFELGRTL